MALNGKTSGTINRVKTIGKISQGSYNSYTPQNRKGSMIEDVASELVTEDEDEADLEDDELELAALELHGGPNGR